MTSYFCNIGLQRCMHIFSACNLTILCSPVAKKSWRKKWILLEAKYHTKVRQVLIPTIFIFLSLWRLGYIFMKEKTTDIISLLWVWFLCKKQPFSVLWQPFCIISIIEVDLMCAISKQCQQKDYSALKTLNFIVSQL